MGSLYLLVALEAGVDGTLFSMRVRSELAVPFVSRVYNVLITAHAFLMIFFLIMPALLGGFTNLLVLYLGTSMPIVTLGGAHQPRVGGDRVRLALIRCVSPLSFECFRR